MKQRHVKPGYMPESFYDWLKHLERCEAFALGKKGKSPRYVFSNKMFKDVPGSEEDCARAMLEVDAWLAKEVRSSVKFAVSIDTISEMINRYSDELTYIMNTREFRLPYPSCTVVVSNGGHDDHVVALQEVNSDHGNYKELGIEDGEKFISMSLCYWRQEGVQIGEKVRRNNHISNVPVELHFKIGDLFCDTAPVWAIAPGIEPTDDADKFIDMTHMCIRAWLMSFHLSSVLRTKQVGVTPQQAQALAERKKYQHKRKHPMYEHFVTELEVDDVEPSHTGVSRLQSRKRLHQVMGHPRTLRSGKTIMVKPHWRGDKKLGVVKRDFEMKLHETGDKHDNGHA